MATLSIQEIYQSALSAGFTPQQATTWTAIALAESGGRTGALNDKGEHSVGLWQINVAADVRRNDYGDLTDPRVNAKAAYEISRHGKDMRPWTTTHDSNKGTNADYRTHLAKVEAVTGVQGDGRGVEGYGAKLPPPLPESGTPAAVEPTAGYDQALAGRPVGSQLDSDRDGLTDAFEQATGSNPRLADTDRDGLSDGYEIAKTRSDPRLADTDRDQLSDATEGSLGTSASQWDSDHDGLSDAAEVRYGSNPLYAEAGDGTAPAPTGTPMPGAAQTMPGAAPAYPGVPQGPPTFAQMQAQQLAMQQQGIPQQVTPQQGMPYQAMPQQGVPQQVMPQQGMPYQAMPQQAMQQQGMQQQAMQQAAMQRPGQQAMQQTAMRQPGAESAGSNTKLDRFIDVARAQAGDDYVFGSSAKLSDPDPEVFDCSELTRWAAHQAGVKIPDGAMYQYLDLKNKNALMPVDEALRTKGALLFYFSREPTPGGGRPSKAHVAISLGDGRTIEAKGTRYGVGEFSAGGNRFNYAGVIPGLDTAAPSMPKTPQTLIQQPVPTPAYDQIDDGAPVQAPLDSDSDGLTDAFEKLAGMNPNSADTDKDGLADAFEAIKSHTDPLSADTDRDRVSDAAELAAGSDPGKIPGIAGVSGQGQFAELVRYGVKDADRDGLSDNYEKKAGLNPMSADSDGDSLSDSAERSLGTNPALFDSDYDGIGDALEVRYGSGLGQQPAPLGAAPFDPTTPALPDGGPDADPDTPN